MTKEELDSAKTLYVGHYPLGLETPVQVASRIIIQGFYGLPEDYLDKYLDNVRVVSVEDIEGAIMAIE